MTQTLDTLAAGLANGTACDPGVEAPDRSGQMIKTPAAALGLVRDSGIFGLTLSDAKRAYTRGETVSVTFTGANPRNIAQLKADGTLADYDDDYSFMQVQRLTDGGKTWTTYRTDADPYTSFTWKRTAGLTSRVTLNWLLKDESLEPGTYRLRYTGLARTALGRYLRFTGLSRSFTVSG